MPRFFLIALTGAALAAPPVGAQTDAPQSPNAANAPVAVISSAQAEALAAPVPIKLDLSEVTLSEALDELQKQSGVALDYLTRAPQGTLSKKLSVYFETPSFNRAFAEIMGEAGVKGGLQRDSVGASWWVAFNQSQRVKDAPEVSEGLMVMRLLGLDSRLYRSLSWSDDQTDLGKQEESLVALLGLAPDARLPLVGAPQVSVTRAEDERGRSLIGPVEAPTIGAAVRASNPIEPPVALMLRPPADDAKMLAHLEGTVTYGLVSKTQLWQIPDLLASKRWSRSFETEQGKFEMTLQPRLLGGDLDLQLEVTGAKKALPDEVVAPLLQAPQFVAAITIRDANGVRLRSKGYNFSGSGDGRARVRATFVPLNSSKKPRGPLQWSFEAPTEWVQAQAQFAFTDVPLP